MEEKNRFSKLLEQLMTEAEVKNYTLAQELQYDVSYISKWISGRMMPAEKTERRVLGGICHCIVSSASEEGLLELMTDYSIDNPEQLELAIYDHLSAEYNYVRSQEKNANASIGEKTLYYPELSMSQYMEKKQHPVLRRVKSLDVIALVDLMALDHENRQSFISMEGGNVSVKTEHTYPDVRYSVIIDLSGKNWDDIYDTLFLIHTMATSQHINFQIYSNIRACGRAVFVVNNDFLLCGMLNENNRCISVVVSEDSKSCSTIYENLKGMLHQDAALFQKVSVRDMIENRGYMYSLIASNKRWLLGHMTEAFLPEDLFEAMLEQASALDSTISDNQDAIRKLYTLNKNIMDVSELRVMIYESAWSEWVIYDQLDFYGKMLSVSQEQKCEYLKSFLEFCESHKNVEVRMVSGTFVPDLLYADHQSVFLSDKVTYLRLDSGRRQMSVVTRSDMKAIMDRFYDAAWEYREGLVVSDWEAIRGSILHTINMIQITDGLKA
ncbi:MAG: hypothetical protein LUD14_00345 [Clostridiales bacterium]|nr:hypothetical protein [Clostridiales bacterium]